MKTFRSTRKAFIAGRWRKRPKSITRMAPGFAPSIDPTVELPGVRRNGTTAPATGNRPDTVHTRCGAAASPNANNHPPARATPRTVRQIQPEKKVEEDTMGTFAMQRRKIVGGTVRTAKAYSRPQGETRNLSSPAPTPPSAMAVQEANAKAYVEELEEGHTKFREEARADFQALRDKLEASEARVKELEKQIAKGAP